MPSAPGDVDFAGLMSFQSHEKYVERLLRHLSVEAPPGFHSTTLSQVLRANREMSNLEDIRPVLNVKPLDGKLTEALRDYNTVFHLLPLPKSVARDEPYIQRTAHSVASESSAPYRPEGKSKATGSNSAPQGMVGCAGRDGKNCPACFNYNLSACDKAPGGGTCPKGRHVCFKARCFRVHQYKEAHASEMPTPKPAERHQLPQVRRISPKPFSWIFWVELRG